MLRDYFELRCNNSRWYLITDVRSGSIARINTYGVRRLGYGVRGGVGNGRWLNDLSGRYLIYSGTKQIEWRLYLSEHGECKERTDANQEIGIQVRRGVEVTWDIVRAGLRSCCATSTPTSITGQLRVGKYRRTGEIWTNEVHGETGIVDVERIQRPQVKAAVIIREGERDVEVIGGHCLG
jgi:hypothetical protein